MIKHLTRTGLAAVACWGLTVSQPATADGNVSFAPSQLATASGKHLDGGNLFEARDCAECHPVQFKDWQGSLHSRAHKDGIYLAFAELARKEGGEKLYLFCSSCHAPAAVAAGELPAGPNTEPTFLTDEGVTCEACHTAREIRKVHQGGGANASLVLDDGDARYGPLQDPSDEASHEHGHSEVHGRSEFCSACHTLLHPFNGLVIENTVEEWKHSAYAKASVQCQDCHMRTVDQALQAVEGMKPIQVPGQAAEDGPDRPNVHAHLFAGANVNAKDSGVGPRHVEEATRRLQKAAKLQLDLPKSARPGHPFDLVVRVTNTSAGHAIPSSITELRQVWIDLRVTDASGREWFRSGRIDENGRVDPKAVMYNATLADEDGEVTYLPWRAVRMIQETLIPPRGTVEAPYKVTLPAEAAGAKELQVRATLRYRSAPQDVMDQLFGKGRFTIETVDMVSAEQRLPLGRP